MSGTTPFVATVNPPVAFASKYVAVDGGRVYAAQALKANSRIVVEAPLCYYKIDAQSLEKHRAAMSTPDKHGTSSAAAAAPPTKGVFPLEIYMALLHANFEVDPATKRKKQGHTLAWYKQHGFDVSNQHDAIRRGVEVLDKLDLTTISKQYALSKEKLAEFICMVCHYGRIATSFYGASAYGIGMWPIISKVTHTCEPNSLVYFAGNKAIIETIRPIGKGENITVSFVQHVELLPLSMRQQLIFKYLRGRSCSCARCKREASTDDARGDAMPPTSQEEKKHDAPLPTLPQRSMLDQMLDQQAPVKSRIMVCEQTLHSFLQAGKFAQAFKCAWHEWTHVFAPAIKSFFKSAQQTSGGQQEASAAATPLEQICIYDDGSVEQVSVTWILLHVVQILSLLDSLSWLSAIDALGIDRKQFEKITTFVDDVKYMCWSTNALMAQLGEKRSSPLLRYQLILFKLVAPMAANIRHSVKDTPPKDDDEAMSNFYALMGRNSELPQSGAEIIAYATGDRSTLFQTMCKFGEQCAHVSLKRTVA